jgi:DNA-directed RNA polymerase subunit M/transcription elongation factor TFIIS
MPRCDKCQSTLLKTEEGLKCITCGKEFPYKRPEEVNEISKAPADDTIRLPGADEMQKITPPVDHRTEILTCEECGQQVKGGGGMAAHMRKHTNTVEPPVEWQCEFCPKSFPTQQALAGHYAMHKSQEILPQLERVERQVKDKILALDEGDEKDKLRRIREHLLASMEEYL